MSRPATILRLILIVGLPLFFFVGAVGNLFQPGSVQTDYARWGYPAWFHFVTAAIEVSAAALIAVQRTRLLGLAVGGCAMLAALGTLLLHREQPHAIAPVVILVALALAARLELARPGRDTRRN